MIARTLKWFIKFGVPTYIIFGLIIIIYEFPNNLNLETIIGFILTAPIGVIVLAPIGKFYHHAFIETRDFNKQTFILLKETIKPKQNNIDPVQEEPANFELKKVREKIIFMIKNKNH